MGELIPITVTFPTWNRPESCAKSLQILSNCCPFPSEVRIAVDYESVFIPGLAEESFPFPVKWNFSEVPCGPGGLRNILYREAKNEWILSLDDDSYPIDENFFEMASTLLCGLDESIAVVSIQYSEQGESIPAIGCALSERSWFNGGAALIRKSAFSKVRGFLPIRVAYGIEEIDVSYQFRQAGFRVLFTDSLRIFHDADGSNRRSGKSTSREISNCALFVYLRYPFCLLWALPVKVVRLTASLLVERRFRGIVHGLCSITGEIWKHRHLRDPFPARVVISQWCIR